jgi:hypothetical protein
MIGYKLAYNTINLQTIYLILKDKNILSYDEVDFLQAMPDVVCFKCGGKCYYLRNSFPSAISPALFDIYMEVVVEVVLKRCFGFAVWYKLYTDLY